MNKEIIKFDNVSAGYGRNIILKNINLVVNKNDFIGIVGPNGAGKTTLLKIILGILKPFSGSINKENLIFGYVPQRDIVNPLLPYSVFDVVMMGRFSLLGLFKNPGAVDKQIVEDCLSCVGLSELKHHLYNSLSGGQRQRTLIARALALNPNVLILDEPTNGMDTPSHYALLDLISQLHDEKHLTVFLVSHLLSDVANVVKNIILMEKDFFQFGKKEEILSVENLKRTYSKEFLITQVEGEYIISPKHRNVNGNSTTTS